MGRGDSGPTRTLVRRGEGRLAHRLPPPVADRAEAVQRVDEVVLPAERGDILDRNGIPLADSLPLLAPTFGWVVMANVLPLKGGARSKLLTSAATGT